VKRAGAAGPTEIQSAPATCLIADTTRALQAYLGERNIQQVGYTEFSPTRSRTSGGANVGFAAGAVVGTRQEQ
jgi:hypothetical protein